MLLQKGSSKTPPTVVFEDYVRVERVILRAGNIICTTGATPAPLTQVRIEPMTTNTMRSLSIAPPRATTCFMNCSSGSGRVQHYVLESQYYQLKLNVNEHVPRVTFRAFRRTSSVVHHSILKVHILLDIKLFYGPSKLVRERERGRRRDFRPCVNLRS